MKKFVIVGITEIGTRLYIRDEGNCDFKWVNDHRRATKYCDYDLALLDWNYVVKHHSQAIRRIFVPIYDVTMPPWNDTI